MIRWLIEKLAPGVVRMKRTDHGTFLTETPWVHLHYPLTDAEADKADGRSRVEIVCHGCNQGIEVRFTVPKEAMESPDARLARDVFQNDHRNCFYPGGEFLCPPHYHIQYVVDLDDPPGVSIEGGQA